MTAAFEKLQQLSPDDRDKVIHLIDELYTKNVDQEMRELITNYTAQSKAFDVVHQDAEIYSLSDLQVKFG